MNPKIDENGNWICTICKESFDANSDWMATNFIHHMIKHARRGQTS